jgi:hypothetical protein
VVALGFGGEADDAGEAVVVGDGEGAKAEGGALAGHVLGIAGAVQEGEVRVGVEFGVGECCVLSAEC